MWRATGSSRGSTARPAPSDAPWTSPRECAISVSNCAPASTCECGLIEGKVGGLAVHIGARVAARAAPGEVLVPRTVRDLVAGSGIGFEACGSAPLKGIPGEWDLYAASAT